MAYLFADEIYGIVEVRPIRLRREGVSANRLRWYPRFPCAIISEREAAAIHGDSMLHSNQLRE